MQTSYLIRLAAWLPDSLERLRVNLPDAKVVIWDYSQDPRSRALVTSWGWQWQACDPLDYAQHQPRAWSSLLDADEVWSENGLEDRQGPSEATATRIISADKLMSWYEQRQFSRTLQKQALSQREQADLLSNPWTAPRLLLALDHQAVKVSEQELQCLKRLPAGLHLRARVRQINAYLLAQEAGQAWQALQAAFKLFPDDAILAFLLSSLLAYLGQEEAFNQTYARFQQSKPLLETDRLQLNSLPEDGRHLFKAAEWVLPQARQRRALRYLPLPQGEQPQKVWLSHIWQDRLEWQALLPTGGQLKQKSDQISVSALGSLACHGLLYEAGRYPQLSPELRTTLFQLGRQAFARQDLESTEQAWSLAFSNRMSGPWKLGLLFRSLLAWLQQDRAGDLVELGCHAGHSSVIIETLRQALQPQKNFRVYDSFAGLPAASPADGKTLTQAGSMAVSLAQFQHTFQVFRQSPPQVCAGWFQDTLPQQLPDRIGWAYLDSDRYASIAVSLQALVPRLQVGSLLIIDDYQSYQFPGVAQACQDYLPATYQLEQHYLDPFNSLALIRC